MICRLGRLKRSFHSSIRLCDSGGTTQTIDSERQRKILKKRAERVNSKKSIETVMTHGRRVRYGVIVVMISFLIGAGIAVPLYRADVWAQTEEEMIRLKTINASLNK